MDEMMPGTDKHLYISVWAATVDAKSHYSSRRMTANTKCQPHIRLHADILSASLPWLCSFAKQKYHYGQQCQYDSPPLAIRNTSLNSLASERGSQHICIFCQLFSECRSW